MAVGWEWASRVTTVGLEFALPPVLGALIDRRLGWTPALTMVGAVLGFVVGMLHLLRIAREGPGGQSPGRH
jgi:ATP synthase protein I